MSTDIQKVEQLGKLTITATAPLLRDWGVRVVSEVHRKESYGTDPR